MYDHLARMRVKAFEKRKELKAQREAEAKELKELKEASELRSRQGAELPIGMQKDAPEAPVAVPALVVTKASRRKAPVAVAVPSDSSLSSDSDSSDSDSDRSPSPPPAPKQARKQDREDVARKLQRMEKELWKLKFKERYAKKAQAAFHNAPPAPPPTPVVVQVPESRKGPSDAASLAREALALASFGGATLPGATEGRWPGAEHRPPTTKPQPADHRSALHGFGGYGKLF